MVNSEEYILKELESLKKQCNQCCNSLQIVDELKKEIAELNDKILKLSSKEEPKASQYCEIIKDIKANADYGSLRSFLKQKI